jgi:hypothetical protein
MGKRSTRKPVPRLQDPDMIGSMAALIRASKRARQLAADTGTRFVVIRNEQLVCEIPQIPKSAKRLSRPFSNL